MAELVAFVLGLVVNTGLTFAFIFFDERRLSPERLERSWPPTTRAIAVVAFGPLALPVHFWRTRRSWAGLAIGVGLVFVVGGVDVGVGAAVDAAFDVPSDGATQ